MTATRHFPAEASRIRWADLAGRSHGDPAARRSFVFLHGLTFDHLMWDPVLEALPAEHFSLALDLPGHGGSPALARHDLESVVDAIHEAIVDAALDAPIVVGHSIGAPIATIYALEHGAGGVVNVDAPVRVEPFAHLVRSLEPQLTGAGFEGTWAMFRESMQLERVPASRLALLRAGDRATQELVLGYWSDLRTGTVDELLQRVDAQARLAGSTGLPYLALYGRPLDAEDWAWLRERVPHAEALSWPVGHHFPHLADPGRFAELLTAFAAGVPGEARA